MKEKKENTDLKIFNMRLPKDTWVFLKNLSTEKETSMSDIILGCIEKHKKKIESKLTNKNINV